MAPIDQTAVRSHDLTVRVLFFAALRERVGARELDLPISGVSSIADFMAVLTTRVPQTADFAPTIRLAVNCDYADPDTLIRPGDEVAVITPVSGG